MAKNKYELLENKNGGIKIFIGTKNEIIEKINSYRFIEKGLDDFSVWLTNPDEKNKCIAVGWSAEEFYNENY